MRVFRFLHQLPLLACACACTAVLLVGLATAVVDRNVHRALQAHGRVDVIVTMNSRENVVDSFQESAYPTRTQRIEALKAALETTHAEALQPLVELVAKESLRKDFDEIKTFWITPVASIKAATPALIQSLADLPGVKSIREEELYTIDKPVARAATNLTADTVEWGVQRIGAPRVWDAGVTGKGVVVGVIDSGVRATHESLRGSFIGAEYGWFDPEAKKLRPYDVNGHGTHVVGTIAGANGIGVAPDAKWMMCKGCRTEYCPESDLLQCSQFMICPTDTRGKNPDCSKAPRVVSNSWAGGRAHGFDAVVDAWLKAGIMPVFAVGNSGDKGCRTVEHPGDHRSVIGVGATSNLNQLWRYSSRGPVSGRIKPDISAPGSDIRSAWPLADDSYYVISGTSMATPHVSGAIALLLSWDPKFTFQMIRDLLVVTTTRSGLKSTGMCGGTSDNVWPNNQFGHGLLSVSNAFQRVGGSLRPTLAPETTAPPPAPTTQAPTPEPTTVAPTPEPTTRAPGCPTASGAQCGSESEGPTCCPDGEYCQPWNPAFYQCRSMPEQCGAMEVNVDYHGDDIKTIKGVFAWDCCDECAKTPGCQAFTFVNYNADGQSACYLKKGSGDKRKLVGAVSSTVKTPLPKCTMVPNSDFYGEDLKRVETKDAEACCDACAATSGCKAFTFVDNAWDKSACYLKKAVGAWNAQDGAVSGILN
ncbi:hypothetical protein PINS_up012278 [Pythium insidiosum]|nr:hypothetical protein PINS_up012278 [Pythium insidiosum]